MNKEGLIAGLQARRKGLAGDPVSQNILERVEDVFTGFSRPCSVTDPMVLVISTSLGGVVQTLRFRDPDYVVSRPASADEGADIICRLFEETGFCCVVRHRTKKPPKPPKKGVASSSPLLSGSPPAAEIIFLLYPDPATA